MSRRKPNPADSLSRFMIGIYDYYINRGMPQNTAKIKMFKDALEECLKLLKTEKEIPDQMLILLVESMSKSLNSRGAEITKKIKDLPENDISEDMLKILRQLKQLQDEAQLFIENYSGWSDIHGKSKD
ncbi:hypothetical protein [Bacillus atrophaeus]|uniref:hypothetical protein n=1 Tax=Bacillus atrophaeus TaxID=1452 RepID=UPI001C0FE7BC|nr:hypothetical protein [Bacillus atrophaeus]MBU5262048.1 hypothetical protein [Bacillus atrophaeus]MCY8466484.1 hypothetical protein [Bacillus atrophaeus]MCY8478943.1 hypothetical protein [Bacillus atrophaeus]